MSNVICIEECPRSACNRSAVKPCWIAQLAKKCLKLWTPYLAPPAVSTTPALIVTLPAAIGAIGMVLDIAGAVLEHEPEIAPWASQPPFLQRIDDHRRHRDFPRRAPGDENGSRDGLRKRWQRIA